MQYVCVSGLPSGGLALGVGKEPFVLFSMFFTPEGESVWTGWGSRCSSDAQSEEGSQEEALLLLHLHSFLAPPL